MTTTTQIENLTKAQLEDFNLFVRLGDSKKLALKTVLAMKPISKEVNEFYRFAYTN